MNNNYPDKPSSWGNSRNPFLSTVIILQG